MLQCSVRIETDYITLINTVIETSGGTFPLVFVFPARNLYNIHKGRLLERHIYTLSNRVERKFTERAVGRRAVGRWGSWSTINKMVDWPYV